MSTHPTQTPEYWERLARDERAFARADREMRRTVESIQIHERNAEEYEATARRLRAASSKPCKTPGCNGPGFDVADQGPNPEDGIVIPCPECGLPRAARLRPTALRRCGCAGDTGPCNLPATRVLFDPYGAYDACDACADEAETNQGVESCATPWTVPAGAYR